MKDFMKIGEISDLFGLNKQTLHYYDKVGLFRPAHIEENGYRAYTFEQCYELASICNMRYLGYSIKQIKNILEKQNMEISLSAMETQKSIIDEKIKKLLVVKEAINRKIIFVEKESRKIDLGKTCIKEFPERYYIPIGKEDLLYKDEAFYYNPTIVFYKNMKRMDFGAYLENEKEISLYSKETLKIIPRGEYLCGYHKGDYKNITNTVKKMIAQNKQFKFKNWSVHFNIIDQFLEIKSSEFITQIQIPIIEK